MRILLIHCDNTTNPSGGLGFVIQNIIKFWGKEDFLDIYSFGGEDFTVSTNIKNISFKGSSIPNILQNYEKVMISQTEMFRECLSFQKPDLVISCDWQCSILGKQLSLYYKVPFVFWSHLSPLSYGDKSEQNRLSTILEIKALEQADSILCVSDSYSKRFPFYLFDNKIKVIYNGVNLSDFNYKADKSPYKNPNNFNILFLGRPAYQKGIQNILEAKIPDNVTINFGLMGGANKLIEDEYNNPCYEYLGQVKGRDKSNYLRWADAIIIPSLSEPFGLVGIEALASKTLVISTCVEGLGDFLKEDFVIKIPVGKEGIEDGIRRLIELTPEEKDRMVSVGYDVAKKYEWSVILTELKEYLKTLINNDRR